VVEAVTAAGPRDWTALAERAFGGARSPAQCASRWEKVLKLGLVKGPWTPGDDGVVRRAPWGALPALALTGPLLPSYRRAA